MAALGARAVVVGANFRFGSRAGNLDARNFCGAFQKRFEFFRNRAWCDFLAGCLFDEFREFETDGKREIAEFRPRRGVGGQLLQFDAKHVARRRARLDLDDLQAMLVSIHIRLCQHEQFRRHAESSTNGKGVAPAEMP